MKLLEYCVLHIKKTDVDFAHIPHGLWKTTEDIAQKPTPVEHGDIMPHFKAWGHDPSGILCFALQKRFQTLCGGEVAYPTI